MESEFTLNACDLYCPEPIMMLHSKIDEIEVGQIVRVIATDPSTTRDIPKFCQFLKHELVEQVQEGEKFIYLVRKCQG